VIYEKITYDPLKGEGPWYARFMFLDFQQEYALVKNGSFFYSSEKSLANLPHLVYRVKMRSSDASNHGYDKSKAKLYD
jgi:hypothetical protein